ncbi:hypothetical protein MPNT_60083 [Candidatus Methylacidithermus pantelleriae]|uniref:Uncharacterized protein n=1 Tax=Candidatus Methylacidithermus pantelleriae TaxID=2744239 RepID=A0A8J2BVD3_9BACT|nr:hypothetical protein MPNT_60083 [Candidatus Methylacidithermus pantelleriae]
MPFFLRMGSIRLPQRLHGARFLLRLVPQPFLMAMHSPPLAAFMLVHLSFSSFFDRTHRLVSPFLLSLVELAIDSFSASYGVVGSKEGSSSPVG